MQRLEVSCALRSIYTSLDAKRVKGWVDPRAREQPEGLCQWKIPMTPSGIELATLRLVVEWLNQLRHRGLQANARMNSKFHLTTAWFSLKLTKQTDRQQGHCCHNNQVVFPKYLFSRQAENNNCSALSLNCLLCVWNTVSYRKGSWSGGAVWKRRARENTWTAIGRRHRRLQLHDFYRYCAETNADGKG